MKYKLTDETIEFRGKTLHRIQCVKSFSNIKAGDLGGFVETEQNLSQEDTCWIYDNAKVYDLAKVCNCAEVCNDAEVFDRASILGKAKIYGLAAVYGTATVSEQAEVSDKAVIHGDVTISGAARVSGNAIVADNAVVTHSALVCGGPLITDYACICGNSHVYGNAVIAGSTTVEDTVKICGDTWICTSNVHFRGDAYIESCLDFIVFKNWWSSGRFFVWTRSNDMWSVGCFYGTGVQLVDKAYKEDPIKGREYKRIVEYVDLSKNTINSLIENCQYEKIN